MSNHHKNHYSRENKCIFYWQLLIIPFADERAKKYGITPLCASEKEKYFWRSRFLVTARRGHTDRKRWKAYTNDLGPLLLFIIVNLQVGEAGAFSRDLTKYFASKCKTWHTSGLPRKL